MYLRLPFPRRHGLTPRLPGLPRRPAWRAGAACLLFVATLAAGPGAGCRPRERDAPEVALHWTVQPERPATGTARLALTLADTAQGRPVEGAEVRLEGNMSHPGMQPVFAAARESAPGVYEADLELTMAGDWFVLVDARLRDGRTVHRRLELRGVRPAGVGS